jgi:hypothetical protein
MAARKLRDASQIMKCLLAVALLASLSMAPAWAADTPKTAGPVSKDGQPAAKPATEQKLICTKETEVGSVIPKKVCRTPEQIEADRRAARAVAEDRDRRGGRPDIIGR